MMRDVMGWPARRWLAAGLGAVIAALVIGLPTAVLPNPVFTRMTPVEWWNWPVLVVTALLAGLVLATYVRFPDRAEATTGNGAGAGGGLLGFLAVGCPVCNHLVVALIGTAGAMQWWAPVQPLLGIGAALLLFWALRSRLRAERACPAPAPS